MMIQLRRAVQAVARPFLLASTTNTRVAAAARTSTPLVSRLFSSQDKSTERNPRKFSSFSSAGVLSSEATRVSALTPLRSLGGMSLASYMAVEATEGHFQMLKTWNVDLAQDLSTTLRQVEQLRGEVVSANDRIEDLDIMVNDLTSFVELQKDEIERLKLRLNSAGQQRG